MIYSDDDNLDLSSISEEKKMTTADHGRKDALKKAIKEQQGKDMDSQRAELKADVSLKQLKENIAGISDEEKKRLDKQQEEKEQSIGFGTKTHQQLEQESVQTAQDSQTPDTMMEKAKRKEDIQDQTEEEYQQQMG